MERKNDTAPHIQDGKKTETPHIIQIDIINQAGKHHRDQKKYFFSHVFEVFVLDFFIFQYPQYQRIDKDRKKQAAVDQVSHEFYFFTVGDVFKVMMDAGFA